MYALEESIPHLKRTNLCRVFAHNEISALPKEEKEVRKTKSFKDYPIGYFHVDIVQVNTEEGRLYIYVAVARTSKFAYVELHYKAAREIAVQFMENLIKKVPFTIHTVLTDNGSQFANPRNPKLYTETISSNDQKANKPIKCNAFDAIREKHNIEHRLTLPYHPWTNGQVERMNITIKEATVKKYYYKSHDRLKEHLQTFIDAYNFAKRLKTLNGLTVLNRL